MTLVGPNGSGKTTLLKSITGIIPKLGGEIILAGKNVDTLSDTDRARILAIMLTEKRKYDYVTCRDVVTVGRNPYTNVVGKLRVEDEKIINETMRLVGVDELADRAFDKISDGQRQRVLLARALVQKPKLLLLDEPTSFLDVGYKLEFMDICKRLSGDEGIGILMSLHELDLAARVSDKVVTITSDNRIDKIGAPGDILTEEYIRELFDIRHGSYSIENGFNFSENREIATAVSSSNKKKTKYIMVQGTMSSAGKSLVAAGLCRIFKQDGFRVSPFKSQNMALNSYITEDGLEMGRAQVMQAEAAGVRPDVHMNPILLKPTSDCGSQVIVNGEVRGNMRAREYFKYKTSLIPDIKKAIDFLEKDNDIIVIEGAGSPAEINLKDNDIVNMGMAKLVDSPVLLVGDIDRGGVFAQLLGTLELLEEDERARVGGLIVNKFRGDKSLLDSGIDMLEERGKKKVVGVLPYMDVNLEDEDSLTERFNKTAKGLIDIAVIRLPHISNFTDFDVFEQVEGVSVRYVTDIVKITDADMLILPGSKNTIDDMKWLRENGFEVAINRYVDKGGIVFGICGGFQMLGGLIEDPDNMECGGSIRGLDLLDISTILTTEKYRKQVEGELGEVGGPLKKMSHKSFYGYEIHMGKSNGVDFDYLCEKGNVYGTYVHGFFDHEDILRSVMESLFEKKGIGLDADKLMDYKAFKEREYDRLSDIMREHLDMSSIYQMMGID